MDRVKTHVLAFSLLLLPLLAPPALASSRFIEVQARDKFERSHLANLGMSIETIYSQSVWGFVTPQELASIRAAGFNIPNDFDPHVAFRDFPEKDSRYHNAKEIAQALRLLQSSNAERTRVWSIGKSIEGREIFALQINSSTDDLARGQSSKPGVVFMGNHHGREHLSAEIPLLLAQHLLGPKADAKTRALIESRDIWIIPSVNPDGAEWDIQNGAKGRYEMWRKNRRDNRDVGDASFGVDLNRNYDYKWGQGGSSKLPQSDTYMGEAPFSEPETRAIRDFVSTKTNLKILLSFHTFSELILYPWGYTHDPIVQGQDFAIYKKMAETMAQWNRYKPEQSSDLYITTGDTTDWAYGVHGIFSFTFELSPSDFGGGGFYPGASVIDSTFNANLKPCLYLIDMADDPARVLQSNSYKFLKNYREPSGSTIGRRDQFPEG